MTLAEVLLALALTTVAFLAVLGLFTGGIGLSGRSQDVLKATALARDELERIRVAPTRPVGDYDGRLATTPMTGAFPPAPYPKSENFALQVRVSTSTPELVAVRVDVWYGNRGHVELETLLPK